jgi:hypothetical protein
MKTFLIFMYAVSVVFIFNQGKDDSLGNSTTGHGAMR